MFEEGKTVVVGEVAQAHDGSLGTAHAFIDAVAAAGADAIKFQTHIAAAESTPSEPWRVHFSRQDETRYDYWKRMEFTEEQWAGLRQHAQEQGLLFLSSPFSMEAVDLLIRVGVSAWKVASGEMGNREMLRRMAVSGVPVILSSGMSPFEELDVAVEEMRANSATFAVLQCTSAYPCPAEKVGLNVLEVLRSKYSCPVGLSDHSGTIYAGLAAAALDANLIEVHVTLSREMFGPDVPVSVTTDELRQLVEGVRFIDRMRANPVDKDAMARELTPMRELFTKSVVTSVALPAGTLLDPSHLAVKKPGIGIPGSQLERVVGCRLRSDFPADHVLHEQDLEGWDR